MKIAYDVVQKRPGCAIIQQVYGGTPGIASLFPEDSWLLAPNDDIRLYEIDEDRLDHLITITENALACHPRTTI